MQNISFSTLMCMMMILALISKAVKSTKFALKHSSKSMDKKYSTSRRSLQILEKVEDLCQNCVMLFPQDYTQDSSNRVGISIAVRNSEHYSARISFFELERKERVDVKAFASDGSYFNLSAQLQMDSDRTKETALNQVVSSGLTSGGFGATHEMSLRKLIWVVTRISIQVEKYSIWGDVVEIDTRVAASGKNGMHRDWIIQDYTTTTP